jgi:hypothetical protein
VLGDVARSPRVKPPGVDRVLLVVYRTGVGRVVVVVVVLLCEEGVVALLSLVVGVDLGSERRAMKTGIVSSRFFSRVANSLFRRSTLADDCCW